MSDPIDWLHSSRGVCKVDLYSPTERKEQERKVVRYKITPTKVWEVLACGYRYTGTPDRLMKGDSVVYKQVSSIKSVGDQYAYTLRRDKSREGQDEEW